MTKKLHGWIVLFIGIFFITACSKGEPYQNAYTVNGNIDEPRTLEKTSSFLTTDNLQLALEFNEHFEDLRVEINWIAPSGNSIGILNIDVASDIKRMYAEFDLERAQLKAWEQGEWKAEIRVEQVLVDTIVFMVTADSELIQTTTPFGK